MHGLENMLSSVLFRVFLVGSGVFGVAFFGGIAALIAARSFGRGRKLHLDRTPIPRTMFQLSLAMTSVALLCAIAGIAGPRFAAVVWEVLGIATFVAIILWCWHWVEHEFAWPGWFVPVEAKDEPGRYFVRREAKRREKAELLALGNELLRRERETGQRSDDSTAGHGDDSGNDTPGGSPPGDERP